MSGKSTPPKSENLSPAERRNLSVQAWESLFRAQVATMRTLRENPIFRELSMRDYDVLYTLSCCPTGWLRLSELNRHVLLSQPSLSRLVERLETQGLVERKTAQEDRRGLVIGLTEAGRAVQRRLGREHVKDIDDLVGHALDPDELQELDRLSRKLSAAVANYHARWSA